MMVGNDYAYEVFIVNLSSDNTRGSSCLFGIKENLREAATELDSLRHFLRDEADLRSRKNSKFSGDPS